MSILLVVAFLLPAVFYGIAAWQAARRVRDPAVDATRSAAPPSASRQSASRWHLAGLVAHLAGLAVAFWPSGALHLGFASILSAALWVGVAVLWVEGLRAPVQALRMLLLPIAAVSAMLPWAFPGGDMAGHGGGPMFVPHVMVGTLAYAVLLLAAAHATLMATAERALHGRHGGARPRLARFIDDLPPLLVLERVLFRFIAVGFALLTLTLASGFVFSEEIFGRAFRFEHKTMLAVVAWLVFATLLVGRRLRGWRGRLALRLTFAGFGVLLLAYVGTRFVLEVVLHRV